MTMGLSMALHEKSVMDPRLGHVVNHDLAEYHVAANADVGDIEAHWLDEHDPLRQRRWAPRASARSASSARPRRCPTPCYHATGVRVRDLPITLDAMLPALP